MGNKLWHDVPLRLMQISDLYWILLVSRSLIENSGNVCKSLAAQMLHWYYMFLFCWYFKSWIISSREVFWSRFWLILPELWCFTHLFLSVVFQSLTSTSSLNICPLWTVSLWTPVWGVKTSVLYWPHIWVKGLALNISAADSDRKELVFFQK